MLERGTTYLALVLVDMLSEEDIAAGRFKDYDVLTSSTRIPSLARRPPSGHACEAAHICSAPTPDSRTSRDGGFVPAELKEQYPIAQRRILTGLAVVRGGTRLVAVQDVRWWSVAR